MGGNAFCDVNSISRQDVLSTAHAFMAYLSERAGWDIFKAKHMSLIGSSVNPSRKIVHDIDFAMEVGDEHYNRMTVHVLETKLRAQGLGLYRTKIWPGLNILSVRFPIHHKACLSTDRFCQIDVMQVRSLNWAKWYYQCGDGLDNKYRALLLADLFRVVDGNWYISPSQGIFKRFRKTFYSSEPTFVTEHLFQFGGWVPAPSQVSTPEECFEIIRRPDWAHAKLLPRVLDAYRETLATNQLPFPKQLDMSLCA